MNPALRNFHDNENLREAVKAFLIESLKQMAVERVFEKQSTSGIYEGKKAIEYAFNKLDEMYATIPKASIINSR